MQCGYAGDPDIRFAVTYDIATKTVLDNTMEEEEFILRKQELTR